MTKLRTTVDTAKFATSGLAKSAAEQYKNNPALAAMVRRNELGDSYPTEPGYYTKTFEAPSHAMAQEAFEHFLRVMQATADIRPNFRVLSVTPMNKFRSEAIFVTYSL